MRISTNLFNELLKAVRPYMSRYAHSNERARWNALWASRFDVRRLYDEGLNDKHIDTALKKIANLQAHSTQTG